MLDGTISGLRIYPIKSMGGIELHSAVVEKRGLQHDRRWMLVDADGVFMTQRTDTRLALFRLEEVVQGIQVKDPAGDYCVLPYEASGESVNVTVWKSVCEAQIVSSEVSEWFSDSLGKKCALVHMPENSVRPSHADYSKDGDIVAFSDAFQILVISEASLADLNGRLEVPLPFDRFRPNMILKGTGAFAEDFWQGIQIGSLRLRFAKQCGRCSVTATNQQTGEVGTEPLKTLATYRLAGQNVQFGSYFVPDTMGQINVGDQIQAISKSD